MNETWWADRIPWPDVLFRDTGHLWIAAPLAIVCVILIVYALVLIVTAIRDRDSTRDLLVNSYDFWLGQFFLGDAIFYAILAVATSRDDAVDVWVVLLFVAIAIPAILAFRLWVRGRWM